MARKYWSETDPARTRILTFEGAFHGRSSAAIAASGSEKMVKGFGPLLPGFTVLPFGDHDALKAAMAEPDVGAVLVEPIQGEGGIRPLPDVCLKGLRAACDETGALLILDEVQCGMGRTGRLFAHEWAGIAPDIMMVAKGIGGGFPLGAVLATEAAAKGMVVGTHGSTYGGNPLGCAIGARVVEIVSDPGFLAEVNRKAGLLRQGLEGLVASHPDVFEAVRGAGLLLGLKCRAPAADVVAAARDEQLLTVAAADNTVRLLPALNIPDEDDRARRLRASTAPRPGSRPPDASLVLKTPGERAAARGGRAPVAPPSEKTAPMPSFLDIDRTDPSDLRAILTSARAMKDARGGRPEGHARRRPAARRPHGRADLREAVDPDPGVVRRRDPPDGRADHGAVGLGDAARPWRDHRRHRARPVALCRPDHDPHLRGGDAARDGRACDGPGDQRTDQPQPSLPDHGRRDDLRRASRPDRGAQGGLVRRRQQRLRLVRPCRRAVRLRSDLHRPRDARSRAGFLEAARAKGAKVTVERNPDKAVEGADLVVTDTWVSMHDPQSARERRHNQLRGYQVNEALMAKAGPDALFMHCLPAHRDDEATSAVMDGPRSVIWDEAENRLHAQKAILRWCLGV